MKKNQYRISVMRQLYPFFHGVRKWFVANAGISVLLKISALCMPLFYAIFVEKVLLAKNMEYLGVVAAGSICLQLLISVLNICKVKCSYRVNNTVFKRVRIKALQHYFDKVFETDAAVKAGDVKVVLEDDINKLSAFGEGQSIGYVLNSIYTAILVILLIGMDWRLSLLSLWFIPVTFWLDHMVSRKEKGIVGVLNTNDGNWGTWLDESIKGWKEIRVNRLAGKREEEFEAFQRTDETNFTVWLRYWVTRVLAIPKIKDDFIMQFLLYFIGGILIYHRYLTIGVLLVFVQYYGMLSNTVRELSLADANLQSDMICFDRIMERLVTENTVENEGYAADGNGEADSCGEETPWELSGIRVTDVSFRYPDGDKEIIRNLSFEVRRGERVVIRGASGAGKSTLLKLLIGALKPCSGTISYGGQELSRRNTGELYQKLAYISQDAVLFNDTILENLRLGNEDADMEVVKDACERARIYDYIRSLPDGFQTVIGENGSMLSGGQRQRLLLARAFVRDVKLYIFDEATSALDGKVEGEIEEALQCIPEDRTVIVVTHREHFFDMCDREVVL